MRVFDPSAADTWKARKADGERFRLLLLDDHDGSRMVLQWAFRALGYECETVRSAVEAISALKSYRPDLVIYEWYRSADDRIGLSVLLRRQAALDGLAPAIIVMSSLNEPDDFRRLESIDAYLVKPLRPPDVAAILRRRNAALDPPSR